MLEDAGMQAEDIDDLVLVGGSTRIPRIQQLIRNMFDGKELSRDIHPDEAVAIGAVITAGQHSTDCEPAVLNIKDVTSLSLGIKIKGGSTEVIIHKKYCNTSGKFETVHDHKKKSDFS